MTNQLKNCVVDSLRYPFQFYRSYNEEEIENSIQLCKLFLWGKNRFCRETTMENYQFLDRKAKILSLFLPDKGVYGTIILNQTFTRHCICEEKKL